MFREREFYQEIIGEEYPLNNGSFNVLSIVKVSVVQLMLCSLKEVRSKKINMPGTIGFTWQKKIFGNAISQANFCN
jgi:hypothetical protein